MTKHHKNTHKWLIKNVQNEKIAKKGKKWQIPKKDQNKQKTIMDQNWTTNEFLIVVL